MADQTSAVGMERKLSAIFSTDVVGYSRLMGQDEEATIRTLTTYRELIATRIQHYRGRVVDSPGDNLLAEFASAVDAVQCAVEIQRELKVRNAEFPDKRKMQYRIGINVGDVIVEGERLYGDGVNIAARLESLAIPGGICISGTVYDQVETKLPLQYEYQGEQTVKNIAKPVRVYRVGLEIPSPPRGEGQGEGATKTAESSEFQVPGSKAKERRAGFARQKWALMTVVGLLLIAGTFVAVRYLSLPTSTQPPTPSPQAAPAALPLPDKPSIVVLPFTNMSGDPEQEYFSDGMTEDLITDLSRLSGLFVIARTSTFTYKGKAVKVEDVARELGVQYVLEGSVRKTDNRVLITAQLVDALTGHHVWAERYDRPLQDLFTLQEEVRRKIVAHLAVKLTDEEEAWWERAYTRNPKAYDYLLRGLESQWHFTKEAFNQARQMYQKAIELDPTYAVAYAWLGWTYYMEWFYQLSDDPQALEQALTMEQQAIALDDSLSLAHDVLGAVYLYKNKQYEQAIAEAKRAIALSPNFYSPYGVLAASLIFAGRPAEAIDELEKAIRLNPSNPLYLASYLTGLGVAYSMTGRVEEAITALKRAVSLVPNFSLPHESLASIYSALGREEEAQAEAAEVMRLNPRFSLEGLKQRLPVKDPADLERYLASLRKAGLK
jgi:adenylate cyclase